jgi:hypothetical protein
MSLATGGRAIGATSTRSSSASRARRRASSMRTMPTCSPAGPTSRTSETRIRSLIRGSVLICPPVGCRWFDQPGGTGSVRGDPNYEGSPRMRRPRNPREQDGIPVPRRPTRQLSLADAVRVGDQVSTCGFSARLNRSQSRYHRGPDWPHIRHLDIRQTYGRNRVFPRLNVDSAQVQSGAGTIQPN